MNIEFELSQQQDINDTPITHFDETRGNGSDSNFIFEKLRRSISIKPTQPHRKTPLQKKTLRYRLIEIFIAV